MLQSKKSSACVVLRAVLDCKKDKESWLLQSEFKTQIGNTNRACVNVF